MGNEKTLIAKQMLGLLKAGRGKIAPIAKTIGPGVYEEAVNWLDMLTDAPKAAMEKYAAEFNPTPSVISNIQKVRDVIGNIGSIPMAPPFLGQGSHTRGYVPETKFTLSPWGMSGMGSMGNMYDPYLEDAVKNNQLMKQREASEDDAVRKPFEDWESLQQRAAARHKDTIAFQQKMRTDPRVLKAANNDPKQVARIVHEMTKLRDGRNTFNPGDFIRYHDTVNSVPFGSLKAGPMTENWYDLSDRTGRRPFIIR